MVFSVGKLPASENKCCHGIASYRAGVMSWSAGHECPSKAPEISGEGLISSQLVEVATDTDWEGSGTS